MKKRKKFALKVSTNEDAQDEEKEDGEDLKLIIRKFKKFIKLEISKEESL